VVLRGVEVPAAPETVAARPETVAAETVAAAEGTKTIQGAVEVR